MKSALRSTGIEGVGDKPWGTHFCLFYETKQDLIDLLIPYFKAGLENHEFCLCVASEPLIAEEAERALRNAVPEFERHVANGQIEIISHLQWYLADGHFDSLRVRQGWIEKLEQGLARGCVGMRFAANVFWLERQDWDRFADYEGKLDEVFGKLLIVALCAYPLARCSSTDMLDVVRHHQFSLARRGGTWERLEGPELQRAHAEIRRLNTDLARRVEERSAQLAAANEQLKAEIAVRQQAEDQLRLIIDTIPAMVFTTLPDGFIDYINQRWRQFLGLPLESVQGWNWEATIHPEDHARSVDHWRSTIAAGQPTENELRVRRADGVYRWILGRFVPLRDGSGKIVRWYGVATDIDDRKRAEQAVRESHQLLQQVLATLPVGVIVTDRAGNIVLVNAASKRIWGDIIVSGRERWAQSKGFWHGSGERIAPENWASVRALSDGRTSLNELIDIETYDGQHKTIQNSAAPIHDAEGLIVGSVIVNEDVTERVRAEKALRESADRLQHLSRRLLEVQEEERRHLSRELHDEFGQLLATITVQLHAAKSVAGAAAQPRLEECCALLRRAGEQVRSLALELRPTMLEAAGLDATLHWLADQHEQQTGIATQVVGHLNGVSSDLATACLRVVQEALTNIVRHAGAHHVWIELSQSESVLELVVRDDGVGFDVDRTLEQAAHRGRLGLLGMRERVQILGGSLEVDSEPGRGTRIRISFPLEHKNEPPG